jgi:quinol monooxygenase YgiN
MVQVVVTFAAILVALTGTGVLLARAFAEQRPHLFAWLVTLLGLCIALGAATVAMMTEFSGPLFRGLELGGALIAPLWLAIGVVELVTRYVQIRFAAWLIVVSYSIVSVVIVVLDPLNSNGRFSTVLPNPDEHYAALPLAVIAGSHLIAVATLVVCATVTALRARVMDREAYAILLPVALIALAGVLIVSATRAYLPSSASVLALGAAVALVWFGAVRTIPNPDDDDGYDGYNEAYDGEFDDDPRGALDEETGPRRHREMSEAMAAPVPPQGPFGGGAPQPFPGLGPDGPPVPAGAYGQITVYTLLDGRESAFDQLSREAVRAAQQDEPGTLIYACHEVVGAPTQRIFYQLFRDEAAFQDHQRRPYMRQFLADSRSHVIATNVIELKLGTAKVIPLPQPMVSEPWRR